MVKKVLLLSPVLLGLLLFELAGEPSEDASAQLEQAETYKQNEQYEQVEAIYRGIVTDYPGTDEAFQAQKSLALLYIMTARYPAARQEVDTLITNFADHPELPGEVYKIGKQYLKIKRYEDAKLLYEYIAENHSDGDFAMKGRAWVAQADIMLGNYVAAQAGIDAVIRDFAEDPELAGELWLIGNYTWNQNKYTWARQLFQHILETDPQGPLAVQAKASVAEADIMLGNDAVAQSAIDELIADFADHKDLPLAFSWVGYAYREVGQYEKAIEFSQYAIDMQPDDQLTIESYAVIGRARIQLGEDAAAAAIIEYLIANFYDHPKLYKSVFLIGEEYYRRALAYRKQGLETESKESFAKAITAWERIISVESDSIFHIHAYYSLAISFGYLGQHEMAINYYQTVVDNWPDYKFAGTALLRVGRAYENLRKSGVVSKSEAGSETRSAYEQLLEKYPKCKSAKSARRWLNRHN